MTWACLSGFPCIQLQVTCFPFNSISHAGSWFDFLSQSDSLGMFLGLFRSHLDVSPMQFIMSNFNQMMHNWRWKPIHLVRSDECVVRLATDTCEFFHSRPKEEPIRRTTTREATHVANLWIKYFFEKRHVEARNTESPWVISRTLPWNMHRVIEKQNREWSRSLVNKMKAVGCNKLWYKL